MARQIEELILKVGADVGPANKALKSLIRTTKLAKRNIDNLKRSMRGLRTQLGKGLPNQGRGIGLPPKDGGRGIGNGGRGGGIRANRPRPQVNDFWAKWVAGQQKATKGSVKFTARVKEMGSKLIPTRMAALAMAASFVQFGRKSLEASQKMDKVINGLTTVTGNTTEASKQFSMISSFANKMGLDVLSAADGYVKLTAATKGSSLEGEQTLDIFKGVSNAVTALSLSADDANGIFRALGQIMSKGTLSSEELKLQIGDRLPGAIQKAADAMGVTREALVSMLESGEIVAEDFLPKFAKVLKDDFADGAAKASNSVTANWNRMNNAMLNLLDTAGGEFAKVLPHVTELISNLSNGMHPLISALGEAVDKWNTLQGAISGGILNAIALFDKEVRDNIHTINFSADAQGELNESLKKTTNSINNQADSLSKFKAKQKAATDAYHDFKNMFVGELVTDQSLKKYQKILQPRIGEAGFEKVKQLIISGINNGRLFHDIMKDVGDVIKEFPDELQITVDKLEAFIQKYKDDPLLSVGVDDAPLNPFGDLIHDAKELQGLMDFSKGLGLTKKQIDKLGLKNISQALKAGMSEKQIKDSIEVLKKTGFFGDELSQARQASGPIQSSFEVGTAAASEFLQSTKLSEERNKLLNDIKNNTGKNRSGDNIQLVSKGSGGL